MDRVLALMVGATLCAAGCTGSEGVSTTAVASAAAASTTEASPTTDAETAPGPWTILPPLPLPEVVPGAGFGALAEIRAFCVTAETSGVAEFGTEPGPVVGEMLGSLDFTLAESECPATLKITAEAERISAEYQGAGTCWTGRVVGVEVTLLVGDEPVRSWSSEVRRDPAQVASSCPEAWDSVEVARAQWGRVVAEAARTVFGGSGLGASLLWLETTRWEQEDFNAVRRLLERDESAVLFLAAMLYSEDSGTRDRAVRAFSDLSDATGLASRNLETLAPAVPHLVAYVDREEDPELGTAYLGDC